MEPLAEAEPASADKTLVRRVDTEYKLYKMAERQNLGTAGYL
jgi:hypothetical protein